MADPNKVFQKNYKMLNKMQKEAVDSLEGPVMVIAGPGTGKTQILTLRIANILKKTDTDPSAILALTFTESGVKAMRERLASFIGPEAYYVHIHTFHSFAGTVITENPDYFLFNQQGRVITDLERLQIIKDILDNNYKDFDYLKPQGRPHFYVNYIIRTIQDLKREGVTIDQYKKITKDNLKRIKKLKENEQSLSTKEKKELKDMSKQQELGLIYEKYEERVEQEDFYDFEDMINFVNKKFKEEETLLRDYQERFQYFLLDEFQDTNNAQFDIIKNLTSFWGEDSDIFVVGDDEQSIYRFQGASIENLLEFKKHFPKAKVITLKDNYRSTQLILDSSRKLIRNNNVSIEKYMEGVEKDLISRIPETRNWKSETGNTKNDSSPSHSERSEESHPTNMVGSRDPSAGMPQDDNGETKIKYCNFSSGLTETYFIAQRVKELIEKGEDPDEIAVLYRYNSDSKELANIFSKLDIPYNLEGGEDVINNPTISSFLDLLNIVENSKGNDNDLDFFNLLSQPFLNFDYLENLKLAKFASNKKASIQEVILRKEFLKKAPLENPKKYTDFIENKIAKWQKVDAENVFTKTFETILEESGFLDYILKQDNSIELVNKINTLFSEIQKWVQTNKKFKLKDFLEAIEVLQQNNLGIYEADYDITSNTVTLATAHKGKGLEFKHVFIYRFSDKKWGNNITRELIKLPKGIVTNKVEKKEKNEDERRLFYVSLTRAKENVYITNAETYHTEYGERKTEPSMFYFELPQEKVDVLDKEEIEKKEFVKQALELQLVKSKKHRATKEEKELLKELVENYKLSVTGLNTYLECPYKFKLNTLLKTPRAKSTYLSFGTAVHNALESFYKKYKKTDKIPKDKYLIKTFKNSLEKEVLTEEEQETLEAKGEKVLRAYYKEYSQEFKKPEFTERLFGYGFSKVIMGDTQLVGKVDRIEKTKGKEVKITDYKTGRPRSRNEIEGKTKNSDGSYKRQLVFYKILCDLDRSFEYKANVFELDFVGDDKRGKPKKETFEITKEEVKELKELILETIKKIRNLEFPRTTDYTTCQNCDYQKHCWPNGIPKKNYKQNNLGLEEQTSA